MSFVVEYLIFLEENYNGKKNCGKIGSRKTKDSYYANYSWKRQFLDLCRMRICIKWSNELILNCERKSLIFWTFCSTSVIDHLHFWDFNLIKLKYFQNFPIILFMIRTLWFVHSIFIWKCSNNTIWENCGITMCCYLSDAYGKSCQGWIF